MKTLTIAIGCAALLLACGDDDEARSSDGSRNFDCSSLPACVAPNVEGVRACLVDEPLSMSGSTRSVTCESANWRVYVNSIAPTEASIQRPNADGDFRPCAVVAAKRFTGSREGIRCELKDFRDDNARTYMFVDLETDGGVLVTCDSGDTWRSTTTALAACADQLPLPTFTYEGSDRELTELVVNLRPLGEGTGQSVFSCQGRAGM